MPNSFARRPLIRAFGDAPPRTRKLQGRPGALRVQLVFRVTEDLDRAITIAARQDGATVGAWVRRTLLEKVALDSARDAKSGRPIRKPSEYETAIGAAVRELGAVNAAIATDDRDAALAGIDRARAVLIPLVVRRP